MAADVGLAGGLTAGATATLTPSLKLQRDELKRYQRRVRARVHAPTHIRTRARAGETKTQIQVVLDREKEIAREALAAGDKVRARRADSPVPTSL